MLVNWLSSDSVGIRNPALTRSALPVKPSTHSRTTDVPVAALSIALFLPLAVAASDEGRRAVVITSSFWSCGASWLD